MTAPPPRPDASSEADGGHPYRPLSALADGDAQAAAAACALWRDDPEARRYWHTVHLIGDAMRSDELAQWPARDAAFLAALRERLAAEPVPMAPAAAAAVAAAAAPVAASAAAPRDGPVALRRLMGWRAPAAVAAGFAAVAAVLVVTRGGLPGSAPEGTGQALAGRAPATGVATGVAAGVLPVATVGSGGAAQIRDPRLDAQLEAYLRAHQAARGGAPAALPGGGLRNAEMVVIPAGSAAGLAESVPR
jgi:sigma-E factor negative regulatory protein RseA